MAVQNVTDPVILDSTGLQIVSAINAFKNAVAPSNAYIDIEVTLATSGWSNATPSVYTWSSNSVTSDCSVEVAFADGAESITSTPYIEYEKGSQSVVFTAPSKPTANIPVVVRIIYAKAEVAANITDEMVSTSAISGASNVKQALTTVNSNIGSLSEQVSNKTGTATPNTTYIENDSIICVRNGNIVIVSGVFKAKIDIPADTEIIELSFASNNRYNISFDTVDNKNFFAVINGTKIKTQTATIPSGTWCYINLTYLKASS